MTTAGYLTETRWLRLTSFTAFYFAQGIPIGLFTIALPAWLAEHGAGLADVATFQGIVSLPWGFKLIAGPFMDRFAFLPMGRRRPWVMAAQLGLTLSIGALAVIPDAGNHLEWLIAIGFVVNSFAAIQDVAVDGMAIDVLPVGAGSRQRLAFGQVAGFSSFASLAGLCSVAADHPPPHLPRLRLWARSGSHHTDARRRASACCRDQGGTVCANMPRSDV